MDDVGRRYWTSTVDSMETQNISMIYQVRKSALVEGSYFLGSDISSVRIMEEKLKKLVRVELEPTQGCMCDSELPWDNEILSEDHWRHYNLDINSDINMDGRNLKDINTKLGMSTHRGQKLTMTWKSAITLRSKVIADALSNAELC